MTAEPAPQTDRTPILYSFRRCPYAMRARMALAVSDTPVRLREVVLRDKPEEMVAASPKATVPVLIDGGAVIDESLGVMRWALDKRDPEGWLASADEAAALIEENDGPFKHHLDRYKYAARYEGADPEEHRAAGMAFLQTLEARLKNSPFLSGERRGFGDIAIFPFVRQFRIADNGWFDAAPIPNVRRWLETLVSSGLFTAVMKKYPAWKQSREEFAFPE